MRIHFVHIDYNDWFEDQCETTRAIVFKLNNRAIQTSRNSFIYFNEFDFPNYMDDLFGVIDSAIFDYCVRDECSDFFISSLTYEYLEYQFEHLKKEYDHILSKIS